MFAVFSIEAGGMSSCLGKVDFEMLYQIQVTVFEQNEGVFIPKGRDFQNILSNSRRFPE